MSDGTASLWMNIKKHSQWKVGRFMTMNDNTPTPEETAVYWAGVIGSEGHLPSDMALAREYLRLREAVLSLVEECDKTLAWRAATGMRPATDISKFASTSPSAVREARRVLLWALGRDHG